ncbi:MAG: ABC transporter substrate-binding protein [Ilumatobacter sp.]|uniref:ABC transporter substrate-binding protein n=1 Tax=Ilumatobacter sp. TaxID=1967498 RepID=UPI003918E197
MAWSSTVQRVIGGLALGLVVLAGCSSDDADTAPNAGTDANTGADEPDTVSADSTFTPLDDDGTGSQDSDADGFDPAVVDDGLVPEVVDSIALDDDVIIATDDGAIPTTTIAPPRPELETPTTVASTTVPSVPLPEAAAIRRVVSLDPTHTETLAELGAADLLVGVDSESAIPDGATGVVRDFLDAEDLDLNDLRSLGIDLVIVGNLDTSVTMEDLAAAGFAVFDGATPTTRAGVEQQILDLARAIGREADGERLVASMRAEVDAVLAALAPSSGLTYFHEIDPGLATYSPGTLIDSLYGELGLESVVPPSDETTQFLPTSDLIAGDPDVIVLADIDCCAASAAEAAGRPGWDAISAVRNGAIAEVPDELARRWGTNIVELMQLVAGAVAAAS